MTDKCSCFDDNLNRIKDHVLKQIPQGSKDIDFNWQNHTFFINGGDYSPVNPKVLIEYREPKKQGGHKTNLTKKEMSMIADYCCFCGRKLCKNEPKQTS